MSAAILRPGQVALLDQIDDVIAGGCEAPSRKRLFQLFSPVFVRRHPDVAGSEKPDEAETFSAFDLQKAADFAEMKSKAGFNIYVGSRRFSSDGTAPEQNAVTSAVGTSRTSRDVRLESVMRSTADID